MLLHFIIILLLLQAYESEVRARHGGRALDAALEGLFARLKGKEPDPVPTKSSLFDPPFITPAFGSRKILKAKRRLTTKIAPLKGAGKTAGAKAPKKTKISRPIKKITTKKQTPKKNDKSSKKVYML